MEYHRPHARAAWGTMGTDWETNVDFVRLRNERFQKAQAAIQARGLGAVLVFEMDNVRYVTSTHIGEWCATR